MEPPIGCTCVHRHAHRLLCAADLVHKVWWYLEKRKRLDGAERIHAMRWNSGLHRGLHAPQGHPLRGSIKGIVYVTFNIFMFFLNFFCNCLWFWVSRPCFLSFSTQSHAESSRNFFKNLVLDPKHAKLDQNSDFGHVRTCQDLSRRTSTYCKPAEILFFSEITPFHFLITNLSCFLKIICFTKRIYHVL